MLAVVGILTVEFIGKGPWWTAPVAVRGQFFTALPTVFESKSAKHQCRLRATEQKRCRRIKVLF